jgi:catechol 2,3-dioxygenase-like lactoylglutathione lyase family enzyme
MKKNLTFGIVVKDYDEAIDFYTKKLGFVGLKIYPWAMIAVTITLPGNQDCVIALHEAQSEGDRALIGNKAAAFLSSDWTPKIASAVPSDESPGR